MAWAKVYPDIKWHLDPCSRLATIHGPKLGVLCPPLFGGRAGFPSNAMSPGPRSTSIPSGILIHPAVWPQQTWAENWGAEPLLGKGAGSPSNTVAGAKAHRHAMFHPDSSNRLASIYQCHRQDRQLGDSIRRTVLQTVAQKLSY